MNSYDRKGDAEKLRVMAGSEDCFANLEATGLKVLRVFMPEAQRMISNRQEISVLCTEQIGMRRC